MTEKILIIAPSWIGDCVMAQPLFMLLKQRNPQVHLTVFAPKWTMSVLKRMPEVNEIIENPFGHGDIKLWQRYKLGRKLRQQNFTQAIVLPGSLKSALVPFFAKIPIRTGFLGESRYKLLNDIHILDENKLPKMVQRYASLAYQPNTKLKNVPMPILDVNKQDQQSSLSKFKLNLDKKIIAICPGAEYGPAKRYPSHHLAKLVNILNQRGYQIWYFGSAKDKDIADEIIELSQGIGINLCGKTQLDEAIDLLALTSLVVCNDSGLMHVAASLNLPLVAIYGSSSPDHTPPLSQDAQIVYLNLDCSPCFERTCPLGHTNCLEQLSEQTILQSIDKLLN